MTQYRWIYCTADNVRVMSDLYDSWCDCFEDYVAEMDEMHGVFDYDLSTFKYRMVTTAEEAERLYGQQQQQTGVPVLAPEYIEGHKPRATIDVLFQYFGIIGIAVLILLALKSIM